MATVSSQRSDEADKVPLTKALHDVLLDLHQNPYPYVPNPPKCKKRAAVALILRIRPEYGHWPESPLPQSDKSVSTVQQLKNFFSQEWVQHGDPEVLFIKRASRVGDRWTGHVALPGGKRDPEDADDIATAVRETFEETGLDLTTEDCVHVGNLPERVVTTSWDSVPLMVLCPYIFLSTSPSSPTLKLQPTEVASTHWVSLRALLSPSLRTVEYVDLSERYARRGGFATRLAARWMMGMMEFSAVRLVPTESLYCSTIPGFIPQATSSRPLSLFQKWKAWSLSNQAGSGDRHRPMLLWGLTLGIMADFLDMLPPHNAVQLWKYPTFTCPDLRLIVSILTYPLRKRNALKVRSSRRPSDTAADASTVAVAVTEETDSKHDPNVVGIGGLGVGQYYGPSAADHQKITSHAVGIMLKGYYDHLRVAMYVFLAWRLAAGSIASLYVWKWLRRR